MTGGGVVGREDVMAGAAIVAERLCKRFGQAWYRRANQHLTSVLT
jgi:hypothetical protein